MCKYLIVLLDFGFLQQEYNLNPTFTTVVRKQYNVITKSVFTRQVYARKKGWEEGKGSRDWLKKFDVWNGFITYWKSEKAKKHRRQ